MAESMLPLMVVIVRTECGPPQQELAHGLEFRKIPQPLVGNPLVELYLGQRHQMKT